ncbi:MAG TPA: site-2 protease family protein [Acidobacteriaceae bacterium]|nr:site-2 protease family protein [Acidobacteriaceae bacterium]
MRAVRNFLCWMFALGAILFLRSSLYSLLDFISWPEAHLPPTLLRASIHTALPLLGLVYALAAWTFWTAKPSARAWGLLASAANAFLGCLFLYMDRRFLTAPATAFLNPDALLLGVGIAGLVAFRRRDAVHAERSMQPLPGDGTNAIVNRLIWVAGAGGLVTAMTWWWRWAETNDLIWHRGSFWRDLFLLLLLEILMVAIHEFGHAAAASALGMKLRAFIVGPFQWRVREGAWEFRFILAGFLAIGGATAVAPTDPDRPLWRDICMVVAGPLASFAAGLAALGLTLAAPGHPWQDNWLPLAFFATLSLLTALLNLIPFRTKAFYSDGARLGQLLSRGPWADLHRAFSAAAATTVTPLRPRDYDIDAILRAGSSILIGQQALHLRLLAASYYLDCGRVADASQALAQAEAIYQESASDIPAELHTPFIFGKACLEHDPQGTRLWWERMQAKHPTRYNADYWIARSAFLWSEDRLAEAREAWEKGNALVQQLPHTGAYETDRDHFALLQKELQRSPVAS